MIAGWKAWKEEMAEDVYERVLSRMERQLSNAIEWRDRVNTYFYRKSGVKDALSRKIYEQDDLDKVIRNILRKYNKKKRGY